MNQISVVIPVYGTERFIARCLESVLSQTFADVEIVVVNDCTPDKAMEIVGRYAAEHGNIKIVDHDKNMGLMMARKSGYRAAMGKYIVFLDSDDTLPEHALETLYAAIDASGRKIVAGGFRYIRDNGTTEDHLPTRIGVFGAKEAVELCLQGKMNHNLAFAIFDRGLFDKDFITLLNQTNAEDLILFYQLVREAGDIEIIPDMVYNYYQNFASSSNTPPSLGKLRQWARAQNFKYEFCRDLGVDRLILMANIIGIVAPWPEVKNGKEVYADLNPDIRSDINARSFFRYLPASRAAYYTLLYIFPALASFLKYLKR